MPIFTVVFPAQVAGSPMPASVDTLALSMLGFGLLGIVATLIAVLKAKRMRGQAASAQSIRV